MLFEPYVRFHVFSLVRVIEWPPIGEYLLTRLTICFLGINTYMSFCFFPFLRFVEWEFLSECAIS